MRLEDLAAEAARPQGLEGGAVGYGIFPIAFLAYSPDYRAMAEKYMSEVTVVVDQAFEEQPKLNEAVEKLKGLGMSVTKVDENDAVVEGDIDSSKLAELEKMDCVDYVRTVFSYIAEN